MPIQKITNYLTGDTIIEGEAPTVKDLVELAVKSHVSLAYADLANANLYEANLIKADLFRADLAHANLACAALIGADLADAMLSNSNLTKSCLRRTNLYRADFQYANLAGASLSAAHLLEADFFGANLAEARLPSPPMMLLAFWGDLSDELTADLLVWNSLNHPNPSVFEMWATDSAVSYESIAMERASCFTAKRELWGKGKVVPPYELMQRVISEKCPHWTAEQLEQFNNNTPN